MVLHANFLDKHKNEIYSTTYSYPNLLFVKLFKGGCILEPLPNASLGNSLLQNAINLDGFSSTLPMTVN